MMSWECGGDCEDDGGGRLGVGGGYFHTFVHYHYSQQYQGH